MGNIQNEVWIVEAGDIISVYRNEGLFGKSVVGQYLVMDNDGDDSDIPKTSIFHSYDRKTLNQIAKYVGSDVQVEDWTRKWGNDIKGYVGVLDKSGKRIVVKKKGGKIEGNVEDKGVGKKAESNKGDEKIEEKVELPIQNFSFEMD